MTGLRHILKFVPQPMHFYTQVKRSEASWSAIINVICLQWPVKNDMKRVQHLDEMGVGGHEGGERGRTASQHDRNWGRPADSHRQMLSYHWGCGGLGLGWAGGWGGYYNPTILSLKLPLGALDSILRLQAQIQRSLLSNIVNFFRHSCNFFGATVVGGGDNTSVYIHSEFKFTDL